MQDRGWWLSAHCRTCNLAMVVDASKVIKGKGRDWSPWGQSARCRRMHCAGRMFLRGYDPHSNCTIDIW